MTDRFNISNSETLFAFDLLVEYIRIDKKDMRVSDELALGVRLLDFPTLLIYQPQQQEQLEQQQQQQQQAGGPLTLQENDHPERENNSCRHPGGDKQHAFNKGKSCLFKMHLDSLHKHLSNTPLYVMVLDVKHELPQLVGSSQISLAKLMDRIKSDVNARGVSTPSCQGEKRLIDVFNLMGEKIGLISLGYKLLSLGASLLPHISENKVVETGSASGGDNTGAAETLQSESVQTLSLNLQDKPGVCENIHQNGQSEEKEVLHDVKQDVFISAATQTEHRPRSKSQQTLQVDDFNFEEDDVTVFCPPHLFYNGTAEKTSKNESDDYKLLKLDLESFVVEDASSEDEASEGPGYLVTDQRTKHSMKQSSSRERQETAALAPNALGDTLRQLPLLNALLVELSQLNGQTQQQPLPIHPNLAWIYSPGLGKAPTDVHTTSPAHTTTRQSTSPRLKGIHHPPNCSTPQRRSVSGRQVKNGKREDVCLVGKPTNLSPRKKLVYGTTKTFRLRLKQIMPGVVARQRECVELTETQTHKTKGKMSNTDKKMAKKHTYRKNMFDGSSGLDGNIETVISSIAVTTSPGDTTMLRKRHEDGHKPQRSAEAETSCRGHRDDSPKPLEKSLCSKEDKKMSIHIPNVEDHDKDNSIDSNARLESNDKTQTEPDRSRGKGETTGSSRFNSLKSSCSIGSSSGGQEEVAEYPDDFTSLEPSDGLSPEPLSSPEPASAKTKAKTWKSSVSGDFYNSDSASERVRRRSAALPVPVKADGSPQRSLKGTHIIRPRTQASALSVSSDNDEVDGSASVYTVRSRNQMTSSCRNKRSSVSEGLRSWSQQSDWTRNTDPVRRGSSAQSVSSFEPQETEELEEDELGSLSFTNRYRHVSELVANKLPGYTL